MLGYDPQRQREVLSRLGMREPDWKAMTAVMATLCGFLLLGLTFWALHKRIRIDPTLRAWNRLSRKLARVGLARRDWRGPGGLRHRVAHAHPELSQSMETDRRTLHRLRYGKLDGNGGTAADREA